ncbi:MAG: hypothetical protein Q8K63_06400 [Acidimicrobiales bacterium]|nr:hypothetical protein [Acidimicrobiales bacterium]
METNWPETQVCETLRDIGREVASEVRRCRAGELAEPFPKWRHCQDKAPGFHGGRMRTSVCSRRKR